MGYARHRWYVLSEPCVSSEREGFKDRPGEGEHLLLGDNCGGQL